jgi:phosphate transport system protein
VTAKRTTGEEWEARRRTWCEATDDGSVKEATLTARLDELPSLVVRLASLTTGAIAGGTDALVEGELAAAQRVIDDDDAVDALRHSIEDDCLELLAGGELGAVDIRFVAATLRVAHELERSADLMVNVAKTTWRLHPHSLDPSARRIVERMGRQAAVQLRVAVNAFADRDCSWASALADMDETMDELEGSLFRLVLCDTGDEAGVVRAVQLGLVARHYERIGDHAVTIAEQVPLVVAGERAPRRRRRSRIGAA